MQKNHKLFSLIAGKLDYMRSLPLLISAVLCSVSSFSQITLIPKLGVSMSRASFSSDFVRFNEVQNKFGFIGGVGLAIYASNRFDFQPEILFYQKGWKDGGSSSSGSGEESFTVNFLEIPILAKLKFGPFYINAGPSIAFALSGYYKYHWTNGSSQIFENKKITFGSPYPGDIYNMNGIDFGLQFGAGVFIARHVIVDLRYGWGLNNIYGAYSPTGQDSKSRFRSLQLTIGTPLRL